MLYIVLLKGGYCLILFSVFWWNNKLRKKIIRCDKKLESG